LKVTSIYREAVVGDRMEVTFKVVHEEKSWGENIYDLEILIDGKRTGIRLEVGSGGGSVDARITLFYGDIEGSYLEGAIRVPNPDETKLSQVSYDIHLKGNVGHLKRYVTENIMDILKIMHPKMQSFKHEIISSIDVVENTIREGINCRDN